MEELVPRDSGLHLQSRPENMDVLSGMEDELRGFKRGATGSDITRRWVASAMLTTLESFGGPDYWNEDKGSPQTLIQAILVADHGKSLPKEREYAETFARKPDSMNLRDEKKPVLIKNFFPRFSGAKIGALLAKFTEYLDWALRQEENYNQREGLSALLRETIDEVAMTKVFADNSKKLLTLFWEKKTDPPLPAIQVKDISENKFPSDMKEELEEAKKNVSKDLEDLFHLFLDRYVEWQITNEDREDARAYAMQTKGKREEMRRRTGQNFAHIFAKNSDRTSQEIEARLSGPLTAEIATSKVEFRERLKQVAKRVAVLEGVGGENETLKAEVLKLKQELKKAQDATKGKEEELAGAKIEVEALQDAARELLAAIDTGTVTEGTFKKVQKVGIEAIGPFMGRLGKLVPRKKG